MSLFGRSSQPDQGPRTAEDRARARQEREARRAEREGRPATAAPPVDDGTGDMTFTDDAGRFEEPPPAEEQPVAEEPVAEMEPPRREPEPEPVAEEPPAPVQEPRWEPEPVAEEPPAPVQEPRWEPAPAEEPVAARPFTQEPGPAEANPAEMSESRAATSWFDDPAPVPAGGESIAPDAGPPTVEFDVAAANRADEEPPAEPDEDRTVQWDVERALADEEPRVTRRVPVGAAAAPRRGAATRYGDEDERPVPPKRVQRASTRTLPPPPPPPGERRGKPGRRGRRIAVLLVLAVVLAGAGWLYTAIYQPFAGDGGDRVRVQIPEMSTASDIGDLLEAEGVVASSTFFSLRSRIEGGDLKAGTYTLRRDMSYGDAIAALSAGPPAARTINITIPEGRSRRETQPLVEDAGLRGSYLQASEQAEGFRPARYGAPRDVPSLEGFLFPATYELRPNASARQLVRRQLEAFEDAVSEVDMRRARRANLDVYDVLIIASMVEREATLARERPLVASVIYNRLREGMPLGIDATIRFATRNWTRPLRVSELETDSPYNTRTRTGLPPGPIGSPGLASIRAAADPANTDFLFYVVKPNGDGAHNFSSTDAEFQEDVDAYNLERERRGGQDPSSSDGG